MKPRSYLKSIFPIIVLASILFPSFALSAPLTVVLLKNARIDTVTKSVIENGMVHIEDAKITKVGGDFEILAAAAAIDLRGLKVYPGFVDANTRLGLGNDLNQEPKVLFSPFFRVVNSLSPYGKIYGADDIVATGVTTVYMAPKLWTWKSVAGDKYVFKLINKFIPLRVLSPSSGMEIDLSYPEIKRMRSERLESSQDPDGNCGCSQEIPAGNEELCGRTGEVQEGNNAKKGIHCIVGPSREGWGESLKHKFDTFQNPVRLAKAGVKIVIQSENFRNLLTYPRTLTIEAAWAVKYGLNREEAIKAITINAAQILGV